MTHVKNVAIVGATGSVGTHIVSALLKAGKHTITAITRHDSTAQIPADVRTARVEYADPSSLVSALKGQDVLIITMSVRVPPDQQLKLIDAAAAAGVPWVLPNSWGCDDNNRVVADGTLVVPTSRAVRKHIEELGRSGWIGICENFWYEFSLGGSVDRYGFDFDERSVTFFDEGTAKINTTTWPQTGRAVANLLALPVESESEGDQKATLSSFRNKFVYISSFCVSQKDMFESVLRVTGTKESEWKIKYENSTERYEAGLEALKKGDMKGFVRAMYTRMFYPDGLGCYEKYTKLHNDVLGLPEEDIDEFTKIGIEKSSLTHY